MKIPHKSDSPPSTAYFVRWGVIWAVLAVLFALGAIDGRNGSRPFFLIAAVIAAGFALITPYAIVKANRVRR